MSTFRDFFFRLSCTRVHSSPYPKVSWLRSLLHLHESYVSPFHVCVIAVSALGYRSTVSIVSCSKFQHILYHRVHKNFSPKKHPRLWEGIFEYTYEYLVCTTSDTRFNPQVTAACLISANNTESLSCQPRSTSEDVTLNSPSHGSTGSDQTAGPSSNANIIGISVGNSRGQESR